MGIFSGKREIVLRSRQLENRSFLKFLFPQGGETKPVIFDLPFYENITVTEDKKARYAEYSPFGRSSELYAYMGADSRNFKVTFNMTLPHLMERHKEISTKKIVPNDIDTASEKAKFFTNPANAVGN